MFLADRFLKENGTLALVLPATTLRLRGAQGARQMLVDNYSVDFIITTFQRAAFSEDADFREVLLLAEKRSPKKNATTKIVSLSDIPANGSDAAELARRVEGGPPFPAGVSIHEIPQTELRANVRNWFAYIAPADWDLTDTWRRLRSVAGARLVPFKDVLDARKAAFLSSLRIERKTLVSTPSTFISRSAEQEKKEADRWLIEAETRRDVVAKERFTGQRVHIPKECVLPGLRRGSGVPTLDVTDALDYILVKSFDGMDAFFPRAVTKARRDLRKWEQKVRDRLSNLSLFRRFNISAKGTHHLAFYSKVPYAATDINLTVNGLSHEDARVVTMWYDSSFNILQILLERVETEGAFLETPVFVCEELSVLDSAKISKDAKDGLLDLFDSTADEPQESILTQLQENAAWRTRLDLAVASALGFPREEAESLVMTLHSKLANEIEVLQKLMAGTGGSHAEPEVTSEE
jgi:hypothetical protein